jgi:hypothetical protein
VVNGTRKLQETYLLALVQSNHQLPNEHLQQGPNYHCYQ